VKVYLPCTAGSKAKKKVVLRPEEGGQMKTCSGETNRSRQEKGKPVKDKEKQRDLSSRREKRPWDIKVAKNGP